MRNLRPHFAANTFDLAVCLYTSFGYFARRSDDLKTLRAVYRVLRPGGAFVVNTINGGGVAKRLRSPVSIGHEPIPNVFVIDQARYDVKDKRTITNWIVIDARRPRSRVVRKSFRVNVYSHAELRGFSLKPDSRSRPCGECSRAVASIRARPGTKPSWRESRDDGPERVSIFLRNKMILCVRPTTGNMHVAHRFGTNGRSRPCRRYRSANAPRSCTG